MQWLGEGKGGFCNYQKSRKGDMTYFCERTGRIVIEDIKVCNMYIHTYFCPDPEQIIQWFTHVQFSLLQNWLKRKGTSFLLEPDTANIEITRITGCMEYTLVSILEIILSSW